MKPSEIRRELLHQHAQIRIMMDVTLTIATGARFSAPGRSDLQDCVVRLADALRTHNHARRLSCETSFPRSTRGARPAPRS